MKYPALHDAASQSSDTAQRKFLNLVRAEYILLLGISLGYLTLPSSTPVHVFLMILVVGALASTGYRSWKKPDEDWYQFRALAESVKTLSWRFVMRASPFDSSEPLARAEFRNHLRELLRVNSALGPKFEDYAADADQIPDEMSMMHAATLEARRQIYKTERILDQRTWYGRKAAVNKSASRNWQIALAIIYLAIIIILGIRIANPQQQLFSPDPLLVVASAIIGWMQVKKFNDLAAAYLLTAQEIGIAATEAAEVQDEKSWSTFVVGCEQVFSREHTQWVARRIT